MQISILLRQAAAITAACLLIVLGSQCLAADEQPTAAQVKFFESKVRPLLAAKCFKCHGEKKQKGGLRLDSPKGLLQGGESGASIVPGKPNESLLIEAIRYESFEMPPTGKLGAQSIAVLEEWVKSGAPWPGGDKSATQAVVQRQGFSDEDRAFWSFQPVKNPAVPAVDDPRWSKNPIDAFVYRRLRQEGLSPAPEADRVTLVRRAYFDLIGLPPTRKEVDAFLADKAPVEKAFARLVDRLLESPHYGERWARHWLDLVRYADSDGFNQDAFRPNIWRYRDYVVRAFNSDKPYPRFVLEQLAGDEIAPDDPEALAATGYLRHYLYEYNQRDARTQWSDILNDITDATGDVFLGLGMGCARCHDHKFDPIAQEDYFRLQAFFTPLIPRDDVPLATPHEQAAYQNQLAKWEKKTAKIRTEIDKQLESLLENAAAAQIKMFPPDVQEVMAKSAEQRSPLGHQLAYLVNRQVFDKQESALKTIRKSKDAKWNRVQELFKQLAKFDKDKPKPLPTAMTVTDVSSTAPPTIIPGDRKQKSIEPGFLTLLSPGPTSIVPLATATNSTGRRTALARWITQPDNRLTTRVITNRIWQYHFGSGLVSTSSDFGHLGQPPSHPELLDWLTTQFVQHDWSFKQMHRLVMNSATYRLSATHPDPQRGEMKDPGNRLHWRRDIRRLDAEQIRDAALFVSGELELQIGGEGVPASKPRRSIYTIMKRNKKDDVLGAFDLPGGIKSTAQRNTTTTPTQSLLMINGPWMLQRARAMAQRLNEEKHADDEAIVVAAYRLTLGRTPTKTERTELVVFLRHQLAHVDKSTDDAKTTVLVDLCHVLINSSPFLYVD